MEIDSFQNTRKASFKEHKNCRVCGSEDLTMYMDYGMMPLPNNLEITTTQAKAKQRFPLQVLFCEECNLSQLSIVVDPKEMFSYYTYRSSINGGYVKHCRQMAKDLKERYGLKESSYVIDIAGNDGALLAEFKDEIGCTVLNVDPAFNLCKIAEEKGVPCLVDFWSHGAALDLLEERKGSGADLITATNVFAHVDDVKDFMLGARSMLNKDGVLILEFPYIIDFIEGYEMDTVYFEHLSYFSILPLMRLCADTNMIMLSVEKFDIHGGTVRVAIANQNAARPVDGSVWEFVKSEMKGGYGNIKKYREWASKSREIIKDFKANVHSLKQQGNRIFAFAASAKGNTLLNCAEINWDQIDFIIDETPEKAGHASPGNGIMIWHTSFLQMATPQPDYIIILSWNFAAEIIAKLRPIYKGKFIIPIPEWKVVD